MARMAHEEKMFQLKATLPNPPPASVEFTSGGSKFFPKYQKGDNVEAYLASFERTCQDLAVSEERKMANLCPLLCGVLSEVYADLRDQEIADYGLFKERVKLRFGLTPEKKQKSFQGTETQTRRDLLPIRTTVEVKTVANALPTCPAVQLNDVPAEQYPGDHETVPVREKEAKMVANALPTGPAVQLNDVPAEWYREDRETVPVREKEAVANALPTYPELQMDVVHADWCQEDQRQDEFLKELETAELADPKATKVVPVQCQAVPEVEAKTDANARLTNFVRQEVPVPETDPVSSKSRDIVVQDLCGTVQVWQKHQNELKAAAAADLNRALQQPTERIVVKAQHCSCPAEDRVEVLRPRLKRKLEGTGGGQSGIKMKGSDMHYLICVCSGGGHSKNVLYDKMTKPYHKRGKVVKKARGVKPQAFDLAERGKFRRKFTLPNVVTPSKFTTTLKGQLNLAMSEHECPARIWKTTMKKPYWRDKWKIYPVLRAPTSKDI
uniref:Uncharacterized protein n=1 Tax=Sphaerodactylus townsendi TaxID=933632 RepID=A0ACB8ER21_9SAUR